jgi:aminopeptidase S
MTMKFSKTVNAPVRLLALALLAAGISAQTAGKAAASAAYSRIVNEISAADSNEMRRKAIEGELKAIGIEYKLEEFTSTTRTGKEVRGTNIIASVPNTKAKRTIMLGAHYDRVAVGKGVIDNASGSGAVLELLRAFKTNPPKNIAITAGFWDQEEVGLVGSREFVRSREKGGLPAVYINFDVYGAGDTIWLWTAKEDAEFAKGFAGTAKSAKFGHLVSTVYPPSDHRSFAVPGVESFSFSLGPAGEAANIINVLKGQGDPANMPKVLQIIHTQNDTVDQVDANAVVRSLAVVEAAIRKLDK